MQNQNESLETQLKKAQNKVDHSARNLAKSMDKVEDMIEDKAEVVTNAAIGVQNVVDTPQRIAHSIKATSQSLAEVGKDFYGELKEQARPVVKHVKRNKELYGIAAAAVALGVGLYWWNSRSRR